MGTGETFLDLWLWLGQPLCSGLKGKHSLLTPLRTRNWKDPVQVLQAPWTVPESVVAHLSYRLSPAQRQGVHPALLALERKTFLGKATMTSSWRGVLLPGGSGCSVGAGPGGADTGRL